MTAIDAFAEHEVRLAERLEYVWRRPGLLSEALSHSTWSHEHHRQCPSYERLEFLGDAVLQVLVSEELFAAFATASEGELTRRRAQAVSEPSLVRCAKALELGDAMRLGTGQKEAGVPDSVLADGVEALLGALYIDGGLAAARVMYARWLAPWVQQTHALADAKTRLQELCHKRLWAAPQYALEQVDGPSHARCYTMVVRLENRLAGRAQASSKKAAEQICAQQALENLASER